MKLDAICLTHYHGDHIFGLPGLLQTLGCQGRTRPLTIFGPAEGMEPVWGAIRTLTGPQPYVIRLCRWAPTRPAGNAGSRLAGGGRTAALPDEAPGPQPGLPAGPAPRRPL